MNALILTVTAGYGHNATAAAIAAALEDNGATVKTVDLLAYSNRILYDTVDKGYAFSTKYFPKPYGQLYSTLERNRKVRRAAIGTFVTELLATKFSYYMDEFLPDVVICTHVIAAVIMQELKIRGEHTMPIIAVLTDYTFHPYWDDLKNVDYIVTGTPLLDYKVFKKRIPAEKIIPYGIPVHEKFHTSLPKEEARKRIGLDPSKRTVLCMSGSMGYGDMASSIEELDALEEDFQIICVCGRNEKVRMKLEEMSFRKKLLIYGFIDNVEVMMDAADCIVTKPGGLTTTECMTKRLPMVFVSAIPGQEERNSEFLSACGVAICCSRGFSVAEAVHMLLQLPERLEQMKSAVGYVLPDNATKKLIDFIMNL